MTGTVDERLLLTVEEAARRLGIGRTLAWQLMRQGDLPVVRLERCAHLPPGAPRVDRATGEGRIMMAKRRGNHEGSIYEHQHGFAGQVTITGRRRTFDGKTHKEVQAKIRAAVNESERGIIPVRGISRLSNT